MVIDQTKFIGHYRHVIRLEFPCGNLEDVKAAHGAPPVLTDITVALKRHVEDCEYCRMESDE